jgi:hypothetical protein
MIANILRTVMWTSDYRIRLSGRLELLAYLRTLYHVELCTTQCGGMS